VRFCTQCRMPIRPHPYIRIILNSTMSRLIHSDNGLDNTVYGENLASNLGSGSWGKLREPEDILVRWVEKEVDVGWPKNAHLTQALWRASTHVGCDVASKSWNDGMCHVQVCRYARPGMFCLPNLRNHLFLSHIHLTMQYRQLCFIRQL
jgi:hypothetical protein